MESLEHSVRDIKQSLAELAVHLGDMEHPLFGTVEFQEIHHELFWFTIAYGLVHYAAQRNFSIVCGYDVSKAAHASHQLSPLPLEIQNHILRKIFHQITEDNQLSFLAAGPATNFKAFREKLVLLQKRHQKKEKKDHFNDNISFGFFSDQRHREEFIFDSTARQEAETQLHQISKAWTEYGQQIGNQRCLERLKKNLTECKTEAARDEYIRKFTPFLSTKNVVSFLHLSLENLDYSLLASRCLNFISASLC